jgi:hypothetical protein
MDPSAENVIKWSGFFANDDAAQENFEQKILMISRYRIIVSSKKELQSKKSHNLLLYKFTVITTEKINN